MEYPEELFRDVYWTFADQEYQNQDEFKESLKTYHKSIGYKGKLPPIKWEEVCLQSPKVVFQYAIFPKTEDEEIVEKFEMVEADNKKNFKAKELLFKMHNLVGFRYLQDEDNHFFEGLTFMQDQDPEFEGIPIYFVETGS